MSGPTLLFKCSINSNFIKQISLWFSSQADVIFDFGIQFQQWCVKGENLGHHQVEICTPLRSKNIHLFDEIMLISCYLLQNKS